MVCDDTIMAGRETWKRDFESHLETYQIMGWPDKVKECWAKEKVKGELGHEEEGIIFGPV